MMDDKYKKRLKEKLKEKRRKNTIYIPREEYKILCWSYGIKLPELDKKENKKILEKKNENKKN